jgi:hypothetical protein
MQRAIESILANDQIEIDDNSSWLSRIVLAPKPHQEEVLEISDFIWRFCISYIALNQVTKVISYQEPSAHICAPTSQNSVLAMYYLSLATTNPASRQWKERTQADPVNSTSLLEAFDSSHVHSAVESVEDPSAIFTLILVRQQL